MLTEQSVWNNHCTVLLFMSCFDEINTEPLINQAFYRQKKVFIPTVQGSYLKFFALHSASGPWHTGPYGIQEPLIRHDSQLKQHDFPALIVVPGFAFDSQGNRLGRGKAYYDRFLSSLKGLSFYTVGICLDYQLLPSVPVDPWDVAVNTVLTGPSL
ncbi:5-formyltetrahydrofolate cyclo-ligase [Pillotina sp. SPG140]|jgi:5-formyltetrahydrofolate cyclo-ligase